MTNSVKKTKPANKRKYLDFLECLRSEIYLSVAGEAINKNQYKMLDDRIIEYLNKNQQFRIGILDKMVYAAFSQLFAHVNLESHTYNTNNLRL